MAVTGTRWTFTELTEEVKAILADFRGEESAKELFWGCLSYNRGRLPVSLRGFPPGVAARLNGLEVFASHGEVAVIYARASERHPRLVMERLCRLLQRQYPRLFLLYCNEAEDNWRVIFPDDTTRAYLRVLPLPGDMGRRDDTATALAAMSAADPDDGRPVGWFDIAHRLDAFFPGPIPTLWDEDTVDSYVWEIRPKLRRIEGFVQDIRTFPLLTYRQERGHDLVGDEHPPDGCPMDYTQWRLIVHNLRLAVYLAYTSPCKGMEFEDLVQEGCLGLLEAARRFDPEHGTRFITYAYYWILQKMRRALDDNWNLIRWPAYRLEDLRPAERLGQVEGLSPGERPVVPVTRDQRCLRDPWRGPDDPLAPLLLDEEREQVSKVLGTLKPREELVLKLRFGLSDNRPHTLEEVGLRLGLTRERIRQIEIEAIGHLREQASATAERAPMGGPFRCSTAGGACLP